MSTQPVLRRNLGAVRSGAMAAVEPMQPSTAKALANILAGIQPWLRLGSSPDALSHLLLADRDQGTRSWCLTVDDEPAGAVVVRDAWLRGPHLVHLSVVPRFQRQGLASLALSRWEGEARRAAARNLWLCVSDFNVSAQRFYQSAGFEPVGVIPDLLADGLSEVLMRKRLPRPPSRPPG